MKKSTIGLMSIPVAAAGSYFAVKALSKKMHNDKLEHEVVTVKHEDKEVKMLADTDMRNSKKIDEVESVKANEDPAEKGLTVLDSAYRSEWVANGFPQTHQEMQELEEEGKKS